MIDAYGTTLGSTVSGRAWALKALHPSDPVTDVVGVPDRTAVATTCINYQQSVTITPPTGAVGSWGGEIRVLPDPTVFATVSMRDMDATHAYNLAHFNTSLGGGTSAQAAVNAWEASGLERWRLLYYGVTVYLDAPATASQGSIVAAQYAVKAQLHSLTETLIVNDPVPYTLNYLSKYKGCRFQAADCPSYEMLHQMPNAYAGMALDGCYLPLKLDASHAEWHDQQDFVADISNWAGSGATLDYNVSGGVTTIGPYAPWLQATFADGLWSNPKHLMPLQSNLATIAFAGLSLNATIRVVYRVGIEAMAQPGTSMAPFMKMAPGFDALAVDTYFRIARELKDAYPAEYNDWGKLWNVIKSVASKVAPVALPLMGPFGPVVKAAAGAVAPMIDKAIEKREKRKEAATPVPTSSAADVSRTQKAAKALLAVRSRPRTVRGVRF